MQWTSLHNRCRMVRIRLFSTKHINVIGVIFETFSLVVSVNVLNNCNTISQLIDERCCIKKCTGMSVSKIREFEVREVMEKLVSW